MKKFAIFFILASITAYSAVFNVGPMEKYKVPSAVAGLVSNGDTVNIQAGDYTGDGAIWTKNYLLIRGVGGYAHLIAGSKLPQDKAIWIIQGKFTTIENIEFSNAKVPDQNGAGIRMEGTNLTVRHCYFHHNEDGILAGDNTSSNILIEFCEFAYNGFGDGYSHNLYINHVYSLTFRFNYSHHAKSGHTLKTRAHNNFIYNNFLTDSTDGNSSYLIDMPNGGRCFVVGNILYEGANSDNSTSVTFGTEGFSNPTARLYFVSNTLVSGRSKSGFINIRDGATDVGIVNNIICGTGASSFQSSLSKWKLQNNIFAETASALKFIDALKFDYHLTKDSPAIGAGVKAPLIDTIDLTLTTEYKHPHDTTAKPDPAFYDIGAFNYKRESQAEEASFTSEVDISPNPATDFIEISVGASSKPALTGDIKIYNIFGQTVFSVGAILELPSRVDVSGFAPGFYFVRIGDKLEKFIKI